MDHIRTILHLTAHVAVPGLAAGMIFRQRRREKWLIMVATILVDLDHLLASPVFDPNRCSIGFHPLHSPIAIGIYFLFLAIPLLRVWGLGLLIHMAIDYLDCIWMGIG